MLQKVIGQETAKQYLIGAYHQDRLAHAYLISGEEGWGAEELALEFARFILCDTPDSLSMDSCGRCRTCIQTLSLQHPDLHYYFPVLKSMSEEEIRNLLENKISDLYEPVRVTGGSIHIGDPDDPEMISIRALIRAASTRAYSGKQKIFIITYAEAMNAEAANALLKILEEPPPGTLFFLTSSQPEALLPTIRSRCQWLRLRPVSEDAIIKALQEREQLSLQQATVYARLGEGNYGRALQLIKGPLETTREKMVELLLAVAAPKPTALPEFLNRFLKDHGKDKSFVVQVLLQLLSWFQDAAMLSAMGTDNEEARRYLTHADKTERLVRFTERFQDMDFSFAVAETEKSVELISGNVYLPLVLSNLTLQLRQHLMA